MRFWCLGLERSLVSGEIESYVEFSAKMLTEIIDFNIFQFLNPSIIKKNLGYDIRLGFFKVLTDILEQIKH